MINRVGGQYVEVGLLHKESHLKVVRDHPHFSKVRLLMLGLILHHDILLHAVTTDESKGAMIR